MQDCKVVRCVCCIKMHTNYCKTVTRVFFFVTIEESKILDRKIKTCRGGKAETIISHVS